MLMHEDFVRCPKCDHPYFEKNEFITLSKLHYEAAKDIEEHETKTEYRCKKCKHLLGIVKD